MNQQSRAFNVALEVAKQFPGFTIRPLDPADNPPYVTMVTLRRADGAVLSVVHHPPFKANDKSEISIAVRPINEAPYGLTPPSGKWSAKSKLTDADIAFEFKMQYGDQMETYVAQSMAAHREAIAFYENRAAFAQQLAATGNGKYRPAPKASDPNQVPSAYDIYCASITNKTHWIAKRFGPGNTELHVHVTDEQALAIVTMLAASQPDLRRTAP